MLYLLISTQIFLNDGSPGIYLTFPNSGGRYGFTILGQDHAYSDYVQGFHTFLPAYFIDLEGGGFGFRTYHYGFYSFIMYRYSVGVVQSGYTVTGTSFEQGVQVGHAHVAGFYFPLHSPELIGGDSYQDFFSHLECLVYE